MTDMQLEPHTAPDGTTPVPGITYLYYDGPVLWPFGWGLSYTTFSFAWFDEASAHQSIDAAAWASGTASPPSYAVNVTNTGSVTSDVVALAFYSTGLAGEPIQV
jgi:beta-glucosidase